MKKLLCALLCAAVAAGSAVSASAAGITSSSKTSFKDGGIVKCGGYLISAAPNYYKSKMFYYRTKTDGSRQKRFASTDIYTDSIAFTYKSKVYFRKGEYMMSYSPKSGKVKKSLNLDPGDKHKIYSDGEQSIVVRGICKKGFAVWYKGEGLYLLSFKGKLTQLSEAVYSVDKNFPSYLGSTDDYIFFYRAVKKDTGRYVVRLFRYAYGDEEAQEAGEFKTIKKPSAPPTVSSFHVFDKKIIFTVGNSKDSVTESCVYSMNKDGSKLKTIKEKVGEQLTSGKNCVYVTQSTSKGGYKIFKIGKQGNIYPKLDYKNTAYPPITFTSETDAALALNVSRFNYGYNLYALPKVKKASGKLIINADMMIKNSYTGNVLVSPYIIGGVGNLFLVNYGVYCYDGSGNLSDIYRNDNFLVNAKSGKLITLK